MDADFARSLKLVLVDEGGLNDDPNDHGGRTAHGIIQREYDAYKKRKGLPVSDVWKITPQEVSEIYHDRYWEPWCDQLPAGIDYAFFDFGVNAGPVMATKILQKVLGVRMDGHMSVVTIRAVEEADTNNLITKYCEARRDFYRHLAQFPRYGRGWLARTSHVERAAHEIYSTGHTERARLDDDLQSQATARANVEKVSLAPVSPEAAGSVAASTGVSAGIVQNLQDAGSQLQPFQYTFKVIEYALLAIALVSIGFMIYGVIHRAAVKKAVAA